MKRVTTIVMLGSVALLGFASVAGAALRVPQVALNPASLQGYLNGIGESINVTTDQQNVQTLQKSSSGNSTFTLMLELAGNAASNAIGIYDAGLVSPALIPVFPGAAGPGWFAVASFLSSGNVVVNTFDGNAVLQSSNVYAGVNGTNFGFYLQGPGGTFYTQDARNGGGNAQALVFAGTGINAGQWWLAFEDLPYAGSDTDFNDAVLLLESVTPTATKSGTWGALKNRYR